MARSGYAEERQQAQPDRAVACAQDRTPEDADGVEEPASPAGLRGAPAGTASDDEASDTDEERADAPRLGTSLAGAGVGAVVGAAFAATRHPAPGHDHSDGHTDIAPKVSGTNGSAATDVPVEPQTTTGRPTRSTRERSGEPAVAGTTAPGGSPSPFGSGAPDEGGPSGEAPSNPGPSDGRALGIGAAAGLGAAASAGLLAGGHGRHSGVTGHSSAAHHPTGPLAPPMSSGGDQGFTPVSATDTATAASTTSASGDPTAGAPGTSTSQPVEPIQPAATIGHPASGGALPAQSPPVTTGHPGAAGTPPVRHGATGQNTPLDTSAPRQIDGTTAVAQNPGTAGAVPTAAGDRSGGQNGAGADTQANAAGAFVPAEGSLTQSPGGTPTLYDSSGHPVMTADASGQWHPVADTSGTPKTTGHVTPPVLYDSTGHPVAMTDGAGHVVPISAKTAPHQTAATQPGQSSNSSVSPNGQASAPSEGNGTWRPLTNAEIAQQLRNESPAQRRKDIEQAVRAAKIDLPYGTKNWVDLPDSFFDKDTYTFTPYNADGSRGKTQHLNALEAAATVYHLKDGFSHFAMDIGSLDDTATKLEGKTAEYDAPLPQLASALNAVDAVWGTIFLDAVNNDDSTVAQARANFEELRGSVLGGTSENPLGSIGDVVKSINDLAGSLREAASALVYIEEANLSQFNLPVDDPRPDWEKRRYRNGQDLQPNQPGMYDPGNPAITHGHMW